MVSSWWYIIFHAHNAKTLAGELNSYLRENLNGHLYAIWYRRELGSKSYIFYGKW